jgi:hypothetical protein
MATRDFWTQAAALLALCTSLLAPALAQPQAQRGGNEDEGAYQILQARYGTPERNVDVTPRLKELARQDRKFRMGNDSFGVDPDPGRVKALRIYARGRDGEIRTFEYAEGSWVDGAQFTGWAGGNWGQGGWSGGWGGRDAHRAQSARDDDEGDWLIEQARYGTNSRNIDVTDKLKEMARKDRSFRAGNNLFGADPAFNQVKTLRITARNAAGQVRTFEYTENSLVDGSQFKGWSRGDWGKGGTALTILSASYGTESRKRDVAEALRKRIRDGKLALQVENAALDGRDPAPGEVKTLWVSYTVGGGKTQQLKIAEHGWLHLP